MTDPFADLTSPAPDRRPLRLSVTRLVEEGLSVSGLAADPLVGVP
jgi:hypothetical protein